MRKQTDEDLIQEISIEIDDNFIQKRKVGENDEFICELIRSDLIKEFIVHVNKTNCSINDPLKVLLSNSKD